jgi:hypothetical protein
VVVVVVLAQIRVQLQDQYLAVLAVMVYILEELEFLSLEQTHIGILLVEAVEDCLDLGVMEIVLVEVTSTALLSQVKEV